jgi:hypothetical protein
VVDKILAGDLLGHDTYHPAFGWMMEAASPADWAQRWGDIHIFQQEPLYAYFVATLRWLLPSPLQAIPLLQLLLGGILLPWAVYALGRQIVGARTGLYAAAIAAVFGPAIFYQCALLRDWTFPSGSAFALRARVAGLRHSRCIGSSAPACCWARGDDESTACSGCLGLCWLCFFPQDRVRTQAIKGAAAILLDSPLGSRRWSCATASSARQRCPLQPMPKA